MHAKIAGCLLGGVALASAQVVQAPAPSPILLTTTKSAVLPTIPTETPFTGVETLEGAIINKGPVVPGLTGQQGDAQVQQNTPGTSFRATLPAQQFNPFVGSSVTGSVTGMVPADGQGVMFSFNIQGLPDVAAYGPFAYHIHALPVPADGNCTSTLAHLDPTNRGEYNPCDTSNPQTCQAGDLSGKYGTISGQTYTANIVDPYLSTNPASPYYFGNKAIVFHTSNTTRITCATFMQAQAAGGAAPSGTGAVMPTSTGLVPFNPNAAGTVAVSGGLLGGAILAVLAYLL